MGDTDYNGGGFHDSDDGVFGDPGQGGGSVSDYDNWDWKQIMAAINGMSAGTDSSSNESHAKSVSDPQTLQDAANAFYQVQMTLTGISKALSDQAKALAGDDGPWKGDAADAFHDMMQTFSKQVQSNADVLGGGSGGGHSVPQQLADNAVNLVNAQNKIVDIDNWYANQAVLMGVTPMDNGLIPISQKPELVKMMSEDMRAVLKSLAGEYQVTIDSVHSPSGVTSPTGNPNGTGNPNTDGPDINIPDNGPQNYNAPPPPDYKAPDLSGMGFPGGTGTGGPSNFNPSGAAAFDPNGLKMNTANPSPFSGGTGTGGSGANFPNLAAFPGGTDTGGSDTLDPNALDNLLNPNASSFPGSTDVGAGDGLGSGDGIPAFSPSAFGGSPGTGGTGNLPKTNFATNPDAFNEDLPAEDFPGELGVGGATSGLGDGLGDGLGSPAAFPGGTSTESGLPSSLSGADGLKNAALHTGGPASDFAAPFTGGTDVSSGTGGMPMGGMGGGMGGGAGQPGTGSGERSDASALLDPSGKPWTGDPSVGEDVGSDLGAGAGGEGLDLPGAGVRAFGGGLGTDGEGVPAGGMPMGGMGGGMGGGAGQPGSGSGERSDASALLDPSAEPWTGDSSVDGDVGSEFGAGAGGEGLDLPGAGVRDFAGGLGTDGEGVPAGGMPMMPGMGGGMGGGAGQPGSGSEERSDASALLDPSAEPWTGDSSVDGDVGSDLGTDAGGEGLQGEELGLPDETLAAGVPGEGVPMMPGMGGGMGSGAGQPGTGSGERSDASALLEPSADAWAGELEGDDEVGSESGTAAGTRTAFASQSAEAAGEAAEGVPYMPGVGADGGASGAAVGDAGEQSEASALLEPNADPWSAAPDADEELATAGTPAGGEGLTAPAAVAATAAVAGVTAAAVAATPAAAGPGTGAPAAGGPTAAPATGGTAAAPGQVAHATTTHHDPSAPLGGDDSEWTSELGLPDGPGTSGAFGASGGQDAGQPALGGTAAALAGVGAVPVPGAGASTASAGGSGSGSGSASGSTGRTAAGSQAADGGQQYGASGTAGDGQAQDGQAQDGHGHHGQGQDGQASGGHAHHDARRPDGLILVGLPGGLPGRAKDDDEGDEEGKGRTPADGGGDDPPAGDDPEEPEDFDTELADGPDGDDPDGGGPDGTDPYGDDPDDRVAVLRRSEEEEVLEEDTAAWDAEGESFTPQLWSVPAEDGPEARTPGYAKADEGTWGDTAGPAAAGAVIEDEPALTAWKPSRAATAGGSGTSAGAKSTARTPGSGTVSAQVYRSSGAVQEPPAEPEEEPQAPAGSGRSRADKDKDKDEEEPEKGIADLLVQDQGTWGAPPADMGVIG
ncbi:WXG100 family type VII secretion target [Streptomyces sp. NBC_01497]|uniref:WXG100 family type VII secretion target n=1 Tax=Streptomyces sp. NBC_01497 TaxID=2903885 RepID=UPI002E33B8FD|nr:WXG100 family type VII secretion target [Streptomyces sp. NBC_01497]